MYPQRFGYPPRSGWPNLARNPYSLQEAGAAGDFEWTSIIGPVGDFLSNVFGGGGGDGQAAALAQQNMMLQQQLAAQQAAAAAKPTIPTWVYVAGGGLVLYLVLGRK